MTKYPILVAFLCLLLVSGCGASGTTDEDKIENFDPSHTYSLSITAHNGTIEGLDSPCTGICQYDYPAGKEITLTAVADNGYEFDGWSSDYCADKGECRLTINKDMTVTAKFVELPPVTYSAIVKWSIPAKREDNSELKINEIDHYEVVYTKDSNSPKTVTVNDPNATSTTIKDLTAGKYQFYVKTIDVHSLHSKESSVFSITIE